LVWSSDVDGKIGIGTKVAYALARVHYFERLERVVEQIDFGFRRHHECLFQ
jgi:hypothetical protein